MGMMRVLITRETSEPLAGMIREQGAIAVHVPLVELLPTGFKPPAERPDAALVTSPAVVRFAPDLAERLAGARVVAVGARTSQALERAGVGVCSVGSGGGVEALQMLSVQGGEVAWYIGAEEPSIDLEAGLQDQQLQRWAVYRNEVPDGAASALMSIEPVDIITFASGSAVRAYVDVLGVPAAPVVVIGPATRGVADSLGVSVQAMAREPSMLALAQAVQSLA